MSFADVHDTEEAEGVELSDNVAEDYVEYHRGEIVGHEEEGLLMFCSMLTGWVADQNCHNNVIGQGPPGSGKSLTKNTVAALFDDRDTYEKTDASSNAILDSREWDLALIAPVDEYDKIDKAIVEVLKSSNPEDGGYAKDRNVEDQDARGGYAPVEVSASANPWIVLYAPSSKKGGINDELEDRALILYFSNSKHTRRGIGRKEFGHDSIDIEGGDHAFEYIYDVHALAARLRQRTRSLATERHTEEDEDGEEYLAKRSGGVPVYYPRWIWYACEPIFNLDEDYTNRAYGLVSNLMAGSAVLNHDRRDTVPKEVYVDEDSTETETCEAVVVAPQDVANVLSCLPTLLSTTHQLDPLKRHILDAVDATSGVTDDNGTTVKKVRQYLDDNDIPHPSENTLREHMKELAENYYLHRWESAGGKRGTADLYEKRDEGALQTPNIQNLQGHADAADDDVDLTAEEGVDIDPSDPFADCTDPIRQQPFRETVHEFEAQFSGSTESSDTSAASFMGGDGDDDGNGTHGDSTSSGGADADGGGQASLDGVSADGVDTEAASGLSDDDLDPDGEPEGVIESFVYERLRERDRSSPFPEDPSVPALLGVVPPSGSVHEADTEGTVLDADHDLWSHDTLREDRVVNGGDALAELTDAYAALRAKGLVVEDEAGAPPAMVSVRVADIE